MKSSTKLFLTITIGAFGILLMYNLVIYLANKQYHQQINQWNDEAIAMHNTNVNLQVGQSLNTGGALDDVTVAAKVLENGTITKCYLNFVEKTVYLSGDTVWLNMRTHEIDDMDTTAMQVVLRPIPEPEE